jgi:hypothetical protein
MDRQAPTPAHWKPAMTDQTPALVHDASVASSRFAAKPGAA